MEISSTPTTSPPEYYWWLYLALALDLILALLVASIIVLQNYSKKSTFNKLTMLPYYFILSASIVNIFQFTIQEHGAKQQPYKATFWIFFCCMIKISLLSLAINVQIYEWLDAWLIMWY